MAWAAHRRDVSAAPCAPLTWQCRCDEAFGGPHLGLTLRAPLWSMKGPMFCWKTLICCCGHEAEGRQPAGRPRLAEVEHKLSILGEAFTTPDADYQCALCPSAPPPRNSLEKYQVTCSFALRGASKFEALARRASRHSR